MGRRSNGTGRVHGPYPERGGWRVVVVAEGERRSLWYPTEEEAKREASGLRAGLAVTEARTVSMALDDYEKHLEASVKEHTRQQNLYRLRLYFHDQVEEPLRSFSRERCEALYEAVRTRPGAASVARKAPKLLSVSSQHDMLKAAKTFWAWCVGQGWVAASPVAGIKAQGKRNRGKPQLHVDEARRWVNLALEHTEDPAKRPGACAALLSLLGNLRCCEIVQLQVRDVDDGGRLLWIEDSKTPAGKRRMEVAEVLRPALAALAKDRKGGELLFGEHWRDWPRLQVQRICREAQVPVVSAQAMRGLHASLAMEAGQTAQVVAAAMGHTGPAVTLAHYARPEAVAAGQQRKVALQILPGGRR